MKSEDLRFDCCVAAAALILNAVQSSPDATQPELMGVIASIVYEALKRYEQESRPRIAYSAN